MQNLLYILAILFIQNTFGQVTFVVEVPENTPENTAIYISGDFEGWTGGQEDYQLKLKNNKYYITLPKKKESINFKFTKGSWKTVETNLDGSNIENRTYNFSKENDTIQLQINGWNIPAKAILKSSTAAKNVTILSENFKIPQLNTTRRIWLYLPPNYKNSNENYPVLYMHDGQNLFDDATSFSGEWQVDETLNKLYKEKGLKLMVVGIDNGGEKRLDEYSPWKNHKYGGGEGDKYVDFIVKTLKSYIDRNYRTKTEKETTAIMGSSMGGLISFYATLKYPKVFGKSGVFSPSFWFSKESFEFAKTNGNLKETKMYFLVGTKEGETMVADTNQMIKTLQTNGFCKENLKNKIVEGAKHNEQFWKTEFEEAIVWLFKK